MSDLTPIIQTLSAAECVPAINQFRITTLSRPIWVNADRATIMVEHDEGNGILVEFELYHHETLLKFGTDQATVRSMKVLCNDEWFPEIRQRFTTISEYFGLRWQIDVDIDDDVVPCCIYTLTGSFPREAADRVIALIFAIRATCRRTDHAKTQREARNRLPALPGSS